MDSEIDQIRKERIKVVAGAYRATLIRELEKEVFVPLIDIYYSELHSRHLRRIYSSLAGVFI